MTFEQKIRKALPRLLEREIWLIEADYSMSEATMARLGQRKDARNCAKMKKVIAKVRTWRSPRIRQLTPRELEELDALYERIRRGKCAAPKLKKIEAGEYIYAGRYHITDIGYDRIHGHRVWSVTDKDDENCKRIAHSETLCGAVQLLEKFLSGEKAVAE